MGVGERRTPTRERKSGLTAFHGVCSLPLVIEKLGRFLPSPASFASQTLLKTQIPHCSREAVGQDGRMVPDWSSERPRLRYTPAGRYMKLSFAPSPAWEWNQEHFWKAPSKRGVCTGFSRSSRRRLLDKMNMVSVAAELPEFVSLGYPDSEFDDSVTSFASRAKADLDVFFKRLRRIQPGASGFWRLEWQARRSGLHEGQLFPHFHLLVWGLPRRKSLWGASVSEAVVDVRDGQLFLRELDEVSGVKSFADVESAECYLQSVKSATDEKRCAWLLKNSVTGKWDVGVSSSRFIKFRDERQLEYGGLCGCDERMQFQDWASQAWYHVVDSHDVNHFRAGCRVEHIRSWGGVMTYASKYIAKLGDNNFLTDVPVGRQWGIFNCASLPWAKIVELELDEETGVRLRRVARRYLEHVTGRKRYFPYGLTLYCTPERFSYMWRPPPDCPY